MTSQVINVAIVLIGVYIALGLACSFIQEQVSAFWKMRPKALEQGIKELVSGDLSTFGALRQHPLISETRSDTKKDQFPSYVDPRNFSLAFLQTLGKVAGSATSAPLGMASANPKDVMTRLIADVNGWKPTTEGAMRVKQSATALLTSAEGDYDKLLAATDYWFNAKMDRVSGWYKRNAQWAVIGISFAVTLLSGIDSIDLGRQLFKTPAISAPLAKALSDATQKAGDPAKGIAAVNQIVLDAQAQQSGQSLRFSRWFAGPPFDGSAVLGLIITALAGALGAPFWFDVLKQFVNVRMAGDKPASTPPATTQPGQGAAPPQAVVIAGSIRSDKDGAIVVSPS